MRTAHAEGVPAWIVANATSAAFTWAYDAIGCWCGYRAARHGHIPEMIVLIRRLIGYYAYTGGGDVYFDADILTQGMNWSGSGWRRCGPPRTPMTPG